MPHNHFLWETNMKSYKSGKGRKRYPIKNKNDHTKVYYQLKFQYVLVELTAKLPQTAEI